MYSVGWEVFKTRIDDQLIHFDEIIDGDVYILTSDKFKCKIPKPHVEYEADYQSKANDVRNGSSTTKNARVKSVTTDGIASITIVIPAKGRLLSSGEGWFETKHVDDHVKVSILKADGSLAKSYYDDDLPSARQGIYMGLDGIACIRAITGSKFIKAGFKLKIEAVKGDLSADTFRCNILWGKR